ncbi:MAG: glucose 1-dehydrogenase [Capsulimonadales bacterium]|nr:glucose 1-dehydrogenase [Capsulimonadales bacterium]
MRLGNRVALVTGASSGIGKAIALRLAAEGAKVVVNYLGGEDEKAAGRRAEAETIVQTAGGPDRALAFAADVTRRDQVDAMVAEAVRVFGRIDIVVNNAGIEIKKPFVEVTEHEWDIVIAVNLKGPFNVTQACVLRMLAQPRLPDTESRGKIVNISSTHEDISFPQYTAYCASKGGMRMFCRNLAIELAPHHININNIAPGAIATPINQSVLSDPEAMKNALSEIPWGRFGTPEEVASLVVWLSSDESNYASGGTFYLDGALSQQVTLY